MASNVILLRNEIYTRILAKRVANGFSFNNFSLSKQWRPKVEIEDLELTYPNGILYVIGGPAGDRVVKSRENSVLAEFQVKVGFQKVITDTTDDTAIDALVAFVDDELDEVLRKEVSQNSDFAFNRLEPEKDEAGVPFNYVNLGAISVFEAYLNVFYQVVLP